MALTNKSRTLLLVMLVMPVYPVPRYNTVKYGKHSIRYLGPHIWGKISQELRSKTSLQAFRRGVRALNVPGLLDGTCGCCECSSLSGGYA